MVVSFFREKLGEGTPLVAAQVTPTLVTPLIVAEPRGLFFPTVLIIVSMASLGWVTPGAATEGVTLYVFLKKPGDFF